jgi:hypothetical protein
MVQRCSDGPPPRGPVFLDEQTWAVRVGADDVERTQERAGRRCWKCVGGCRHRARPAVEQEQVLTRVVHTVGDPRQVAPARDRRGIIQKTGWDVRERCRGENAAEAPQRGIHVDEACPHAKDGREDFDLFLGPGRHGEQHAQDS